MRYDDDGCADDYRDLMYEWREDDYGDLARSVCPHCEFGGSPHERDCEKAVKWDKIHGAYCPRFSPKDAETICETCIHKEDSEHCRELTYLGDGNGFWCFAYEYRRF